MSIMMTMNHYTITFATTRSVMDERPSGAIGNGLNDTVFIIFLPSNPGRLVPCILDNMGTIFCY